jgi:hypothetical protein
MQRAFVRESMEISLVKHANAARDEVKHLADEFRNLANSTTVPTPATDQLRPYLDPASPLMPDGSSAIPMRWGGVIALSAALIACMTVFTVLAGRLGRRRQGPDA